MTFAAGRDPERGWRAPGVDLPAWLGPLDARLPEVRGADLTRFLPPREGGRRSAVLICLGEDDAGPDLLIIERAHTLRSHAGQPAFPGGAVDESDADEAAAALREAVEETGLDPGGVAVFGMLPDLWVPVSGFIVTPVLGWWHRPSPVAVADPLEVASVHRVPIAELADPANRMRVRHPSGYVGMGFEVQGLLVWGFTAGIIAGVLDLAGWSLPWDDRRIVDLNVGVR